MDQRDNNGDIDLQIGLEIEKCTPNVHPLEQQPAVDIDQPAVEVMPIGQVNGGSS